MKRIATTSLLLALALAPRANAVFLSTNAPNVMILLDSSGSMSDQILSLPPYAPATSYPNAGYTATVIYNKTPFSGYVVYANNVAAVSDSAARDALNQYGFWFGNISGESLQLFTGNYLNYQNCTSCKVNQTKISIAKNVINTVVGMVANTRFGVMKFINNGSQNPPGGGGMVASIGTPTNTIITAVNGINASGFTPTGEQLRDSGRYFSGQFGSFASPIQSGCQLNTTLIISDGMWNGVIDPAAQATTEYTSDHAPNLAGTQNLVVNTIGFDLDSGNQQHQQGIQSLRQTAANGGGAFFLANDLPALEESLFFTLASNGISVIAPTPYSILSGAVSVTAGVSNSLCISSVQFLVDGNQSLGVVTVPPYTINWNTAGVLNGTHTLTAIAWDTGGNSVISMGVPVTTQNDQTPPTISNLNVSPGITDAQITWQTNELADTQIHYGLTSAYGSTTTLNPQLATAHAVSLSGLTPNTLYHFEALSRDAAGNLAVLGDITFMTLPSQDAGSLDHFAVTFANGSQIQVGPGTQAGGRPYVLFAGDCYSTTIEAVDAMGRHVNFNGEVTVAQYRLDSSGVETELEPGIALRNNFQLGVSSMNISMVNGYVFLGSNSDITKQLCFYRGTRSPGDYGQSGTLGDLHVKVIQTGTPAINGITASYIGWHGAASRLALLPPVQRLAPAMPQGIAAGTSIIDQYQGIPFVVRAHLTDSYWNPVLNNVDTLQFTSSLPGQTGFSPFTGTISAGVLTSTVTVNHCGGNVTLSVEDLTSTTITQGQAVIPMLPCGSSPPGATAGFYEVSIPGLVTAGTPFTVTITVRNVNIPTGAGNVLYNARLVALKALDATHFAPASGSLAVPYVQFSIPEGTVGDYVFQVPNQVYVKAETIWIQLIGDDSPAELVAASAMDGPMQVLTGPAAVLSAAFNPPTIGALSTAQMTATITDVFGNGISNATVSALVTEGAGQFNVGGLLTTQTQLQTDAQGRAVFNFVSGTASGTGRVLAWAPFLPSVPSTQASILTSLLGQETVAAYPNPRKITDGPINFEYRLAQPSEVTLTITDLFGREVWKQTYPAGTTGGATGFNKVSWDGRNRLGSTVAVGIYALRGEVNANGQRTNFRTRFGIRK